MGIQSRCVKEERVDEFHQPCIVASLRTMVSVAAKGKRMIGTLINVISVLIGGTTGTILGRRFPARMQESVFAVLGLFTFALGIANSLESGNPLIVLISLVIGVMLGELLRIDDRLEQFGHWLRTRLLRNADGGQSDRFVEGFVSASLIFCIGPLAVQGAIEDGLLGDFTKLAIKSLLDAFSSLAFATTLGPGVVASAIPVFIFQGGISILASLGTDVFTASMVAEMTATGGILLLAIALRLLDIKPLRAGNMLPAIFVAPALVALMDAVGINYYF